MSIYANIRTAAAEVNKPVSDATVYSIAGALRLAYGEEVPIAAILRELANRVPVTPVTAEVEKVSATEAIANALEHGTCPRCTHKMTEVKLADNTPTKYCTGCHIALW